MNDQADFCEAKLRFETDSVNLFEVMQSSVNIAVIVACSVEARRHELISSAINIPHHKVSEYSTMPLHGATTCGTYGDSNGWITFTKKDAPMMAELGFDARDLPGGID